MLDKAYYEEEVKRLTLSFDQQVGPPPTRTVQGKERKDVGEGDLGLILSFYLISGGTACDVCCMQKMCCSRSNVGMEMRSCRVAGVLERMDVMIPGLQP